MDLYIKVGSERMTSKNEVVNIAAITVDLKSLWKAIEGRFTHIHLDLLVSIPVVSENAESVLNPHITLQLSKDVAVNQIEDYKVFFEATYSAKDDTSREPFGVAYLRGYQFAESANG